MTIFQTSSRFVFEVTQPARGLKYCHNKKSQVFLVNFGQPVFKETKTFKFLMEVFSEYF